jgi:dihydrolipoamide dehydrogenase
MTCASYDFLVIGGGPGGYTAAIRAAQKGLKTCLVERSLLGGTCLNRGCVPTKTLLTDALMIAAARRCYFMKGEMNVSWRRMQNHKAELAKNSRAGISQVLKESGVHIIEGEAVFLNARTIRVTTVDGQRDLTATNIVIATGSLATYGSGLAVDGRQVLSTDDALKLDTIPRSLAVVGAGNRGVEFAVLYHNLGTKVFLIEKEKQVLPRMHWEIADRYKKTLLDRKIAVHTRTSLVATRMAGKDGVILTLDADAGRKEFQTDKVLLTGMRRPDYANLCLEAAGLTLQDGCLGFGPGMETSQKGIYVVGDAAGPPYLAHKAIAQAMVAVDRCRGLDVGSRLLLIPDCIYGDPEVACIGMTEDEALSAGRRVKLGEFHFMGNGRAGTIGQAEGFVRIVSDAKTAEVLGVQMIGPAVTELVALASLAMQNGIDVTGIKQTVFPHPTLSETFFEAALASHDEAIHMRVESEELHPEDLQLK